MIFSDIYIAVLLLASNARCASTLMLGTRNTAYRSTRAAIYRLVASPTSPATKTVAYQGTARGQFQPSESDDDAIDDDAYHAGERGR